VQFTTGEVAYALTLLEAAEMVVRPVAKPNASRPGWLPVAAPEPVWTSLEPVEEAAPVDALAAPVEPADDDRVAALARAIIKSFSVSGRGYNGTRHLCESDSVLREWLAADGVSCDDAALSAALTKLETATLPGSNMRLIRGSELHRRNGSRHLPAARWPERAMMLESVHPFDSMQYEPADILPYLLPAAPTVDV
jgi:hypothetical protein